MAISGILSIAAGCSGRVAAPEPISPIPTEHQVRWQQMETYAFIHFGLNTFNDREWGYGDSELSTFNPTGLDCEQWARTFAEAGMKGVIITAKHHDGFTLWPSPINEYSIQNTPYKDGKGDIVGDLARACRKYGLRFGVYLSPWDRHHAGYGRQEYIDYFYAQLTDLLTSNGEVFEVWFDGANGGDGYYGGACEKRNIDRQNYYNYPALFALVDSLQPQAIIFSDGGPGCRWVGNEKGFANPTNWSFIRGREVYPGYPRGYELQSGHADGDQWTAAECDVSIRPGWFYHEHQDSLVRSPQNLVDLYYRSVGRNGTFLLNVPPTRDGLIHPVDSANLMEFHRIISAELADNLLTQANVVASEERGDAYGATNVTDGNFDSYWATSDGVTTGNLTFTFDAPVSLNRVMLQEYIPLGQRVKSFVVEYEKDGTWIPVRCGEATTTVGYKRLLRFMPVETRKLRIRFLDSRGPLCISEAGAYYAPYAVDDLDQSARMPESKPYTIAERTDSTVTLDLGAPVALTHLFMLPDQSEIAKGLPARYVVSGGNNLSDMHEITSGEFSNIRNNPIMQSIEVTTRPIRYIQLKASEMAVPDERFEWAAVSIQ